MSWKVCPICNKSAFNLWKHFWDEHQDSKLSEIEFLCMYLNIKELPKCRKCNNPVSVNLRKYKIGVTCGNPSCKSKGFKLNLNTPIFCKKCNKEYRNIQAYRAHGCFRCTISIDETTKTTKSINSFTKWRLNQPPEVLSEIAKRAAVTRNKMRKKFWILC